MYNTHKHITNNREILLKQLYNRTKIENKNNQRVKELQQGGDCIYEGQLYN